MIPFLKTAIPILLLWCCSCKNGASDTSASDKVNLDSTAGATTTANADSAANETSKKLVLIELVAKLQNADKVLLVSHDYRSPMVPPKPDDDDASPGKAPSPPKSYNIVVNGQPNKDIIHETINLNPDAISNLSSILSKPPGNSIQDRARCFEPHHAIMMEKGGTITSYLDICFTCHGMRSSADIPFSAEDFDKPKWDALYDFIKQQGIKYEL
ncbi:MAG: hypothetical protein V4722_08700 [Bacteroidota bacterium]